MREIAGPTITLMSELNLQNNILEADVKITTNKSSLPVWVTFINTGKKATKDIHVRGKNM
jgi:hypothetical protein